MNDLTTKESRKAQIKTIEDSFLLSLRGNSFDVCPNAVCKVSRNSIELGIAETGSYMDGGFAMAFASEINLYCAEPDRIFGRKENEINFGSSGNFSPEREQSYWRTVHAASILKNWVMASEIVNIHCKMYADLEKEIFELNKDKVSS
jgi:hypothetical protein